MSLRVRLVAATGLVALIALGAAGIATYAAFSNSQLRQIDDTLQRTHEPIEQFFVNEGQVQDLERSIEQTAPGSFVALEDPHGDIVLSIPAREPGHAPLLADLGDFKGITAHTETATGDDPVTFRTVHATSGDNQLRVRISRLDDGSTLVIGLSLHDVHESQQRLIAIEVLVALVALVLAAAAGWFLVGIGLRPLRSVEQTALLIADGGDLEHTLPGDDRPTEIGRLSAALNTMLGTIRGAFAERDAKEAALRASEERMRRFVADVSHELRTPLAAVSAYTELFDRGARDRPDDLARTMRGINVEAARMHELVEELLLLARLDEGRPLESKSVDLNEIVVDAVAAARAVAPERTIALSMRDVVTVNGDAGRLRQVFDNLLTNVRTHTPAGTTTTVELGTTSRMAVVTVRDNGPGMTAEQAHRVFERFFRADTSRSRSSGGSGLGLAIVDSIVAAHGGTVRVETAPGAGFGVVIHLPVAAGSNEQSEGT
jgi:signal transduction histidine kinase